MSLAKADENGASWNKSVMDLNAEILCVSQFTLYANTYKGTKPDFHGSMKADASRTFYDNFLEKLKAAYIPEKIKDGRFQALMTVTLANDGPVTLQLDSRKSATGTSDTNK